MAKSIEFDGINRRWQNGHGTSEDMFGKTNGVISMTCWELTEEEIDEINDTGKIWVAARTGPRPMQPHWVGSLDHMKHQLLDLAGGIWRRWPLKKPSEDA